jgi:hypothetical protein
MTWNQRDSTRAGSLQVRSVSKWVQQAGHRRTALLLLWRQLELGWHQMVCSLCVIPIGNELVHNVGSRLAGSRDDAYDNAQGSLMGRPCVLTTFAPILTAPCVKPV